MQSRQVFRISKIAKKNDDYDDAVSGDITWPPWAAWLSLSQPDQDKQPHNANNPTIMYVCIM